MLSKDNGVLENFLWRFAERCGAQFVTFFVSLILARMLAPEVYGTIALVSIFVTVLNVFVDSGMGNALIQKKNADDLDFSTVFFFNIFIACILYFLIFFSAPAIAWFYKDDTLVMIIRVLSLSLIISSIKNVQQAYISKTMQFKKFFFATLGGTIGAAVVGIVFAYRGLGIWALVAQYVLNITVDTIILWIIVKWRPKKMFSFTRLISLYSFGWKLLLSALLDQLYENARQLIIGKLYSSSDLAFYNRGRQFPELLITNVNSSIDSVLLPTMSNVQEDRFLVKEMTRRAIKTSTYIIAPLMMGLFFGASDLVELLLTEKWIKCVPFLRIFCIEFMFFPMHTANLNAIKAIGRSDMFLKLEIIKKIFSVVILIATMRFGVMVMAYGILVNIVIGLIINTWPNNSFLDYGFFKQVKDIFPNILLAVVMGGVIYPIKNIGFPNVITLMLQVIIGGAIYLLGSITFKFESYTFLCTAIKNFVMKNNKEKSIR